MKKLNYLLLLSVVAAGGCGGDGLPTRTGSLSLETYGDDVSSGVDQINVAGDKLYLVESGNFSEDGGYSVFRMHAIDIADRTNPAKLGQSGEHVGWAPSMIYHNGYLQFTEFPDGAAPFASMMNVTDPSNMVFEESFSIPWNAFPSKYILSNDTLYIEQNGGLGIYSMADAANPAMETILGQYENYSVAADGSKLYLGDSTGKDFVQLDATNPIDPALLNEFSFEDSVSITVNGNTLYAKYRDYDWLNIFDITDPSQPRFLSTLDYFGERYIYAVAPNRLYVVNSAGLYTINTSDKTNPVIIGLIPLESNPTSLTLDGSYLYIGMQGSSLAIFKR